MSLFPVKVWINSDDMGEGLESVGPRHIHEKLYYVEARSMPEAEEHALALYGNEEVVKHVHAHTDGAVVVERVRRR